MIGNDQVMAGDMADRFKDDHGKIISDGKESATHLCVLIHGLWGSPKHLSFMAERLREKHAEDKLHILVAKTNKDNLTYDGIDLGGERTTQEILDYIEHLREDGKSVTKISIVGYSLGGLVARYVVGLLYAHNFFDTVEPVNFTTFATPHLGVRAPIIGPHSQLWNYIGSSAVAASGRQLFMFDDFRGTGQALLSILAERQSIFMQGLRLFPHRVLYANIVNDRAVPYYTGSISRTDPFTNLDDVKLKYLPNYDSVLLDLQEPVRRLTEAERLPFLSQLTSRARSVLVNAPLVGLAAIIIPIAFGVFLTNASIQTFRSRRRIRLHEEGKAGIVKGKYRVPPLIEQVQAAKETAQCTVDGVVGTTSTSSSSTTDVSAEGTLKQQQQRKLFDYQEDQTTQITGASRLNLTAEQFTMIDALDELGFKKWRVHIQRMNHSHAAIIFRTNRFWLSEGKSVIQHWLEQEFVV